MRKQKDGTIKWSSPIRYNGNLFLIILALVVWLPLGIVMLLENGYLLQGNSRSSLQYHGSWSWLYFWSLVLFPVVLLLLLLKGVTLVQRSWLR